MPQVLTEKELVKLRGVGDRIDLDEVSEVYLPLSRLIHLRVRARQELMASTATFLGSPVEDVPFVIGGGGLGGGGQIHHSTFAASAFTTMGITPTRGFNYH